MVSDYRIEQCRLDDKNVKYLEIFSSVPHSLLGNKSSELRISSPGATVFPLKPLAFPVTDLCLLFSAVPRQCWIIQGAD